MMVIMQMVMVEIVCELLRVDFYDLEDQQPQKMCAPIAISIKMFE